MKLEIRNLNYQFKLIILFLQQYKILTQDTVDLSR